MSETCSHTPPWRNLWPMLSDKRLYDTESLTRSRCSLPMFLESSCQKSIPCGIYPYSSIAWGYLRCIHSRLFLHIVSKLSFSKLKRSFISPSLMNFEMLSNAICTSTTRQQWRQSYREWYSEVRYKNLYFPIVWPNSHTEITSSNNPLVNGYTTCRRALNSRCFLFRVPTQVMQINSTVAILLYTRLPSW